MKGSIKSMSEISKLDQILIIRKIDSETVNIQISNNEMLMSIVGQFNQNLKELEKLTNTIIFFRGNSITCKGNASNLENFSEAIKFLINKYFLTKTIEKGDIIQSAKKNMKYKDSNVKTFQHLIKTPRKSVIARSEKQSEYIKALKPFVEKNPDRFMLIKNGIHTRIDHHRNGLSRMKKENFTRLVVAVKMTKKTKRKGNKRSYRRHK